MPQLPWQTVNRRVKDVLAKEGGLDDWTQVLVAMALDKRPWRYTAAGKRTLAGKLNRAFRDEGLHLRPTDLDPVKTAGALCRLVRKKLKEGGS